MSCSTSVQPVKIAHWSVGSIILRPAVAVSSPNKLTQLSHGTLVGLFGAVMMAAFGAVTVDYADSSGYLGR